MSEFWFCSVMMGLRNSDWSFGVTTFYLMTEMRNRVNVDASVQHSGQRHRVALALLTELCRDKDKETDVRSVQLFIRLRCYRQVCRWSGVQVKHHVWGRSWSLALCRSRGSSPASWNVPGLRPSASSSQLQTNKDGCNSGCNVSHTNRVTSSGPPTHQVHSVSVDLLGEVGGEVHQVKELVEVSGVAADVEEQTAVAARQQLEGRADVSYWEPIRVQTEQQNHVLETDAVIQFTWWRSLFPLTWSNHTDVTSHLFGSELVMSRVIRTHMQSRSHQLTHLMMTACSPQWWRWSSSQSRNHFWVTNKQRQSSFPVRPLRRNNSGENVSHPVLVMHDQLVVWRRRAEPHPGALRELQDVVVGFAVGEAHDEVHSLVKLQTNRKSVRRRTKRVTNGPAAGSTVMCQIRSQWWEVLTRTGVSLTVERSVRDRGLISGSHSSGVRAETLRTRPANRKRLLTHRFMMLQLQTGGDELDRRAAPLLSRRTTFQSFPVLTQRRVFSSVDLVQSRVV